MKQSHSPADAVIHRLDMLEAAAYRDMLAAAPRPLSQALGFDTREIAGATVLLAPGIPSPQFNRVIGLGNRRPVGEAELEALVDCYRTAGVRKWWIQVSPTRHSPGLIAQLSARGFALAARRAWVKLARDTRVPEPVRTDAVVREARQEERVGLAESVCAAFDMPAAIVPWLAALVGRPGWRSALATLDGEIVGGGFLNVQGEGAWLGASGVRTSARGRHVHRALMALRIEMAIAAGCPRMATETGEPIGDEPNPSLRNTHACGFASAYSRLNYAASD